MRNILSVYPNASMGGMMTVYKNRVIGETDAFHHLVFSNNHGATSVYDLLPRTEVSIAGKGRLSAFIANLVRNRNFEQIRITSLPEMPHTIFNYTGQKSIYEFHSSDASVLKKEISLLDYDAIEEIWVPSLFLKRLVSLEMADYSEATIRVVPNVVDETVFNVEPEQALFELDTSSTPLVWVGRFDKGKNPKDMLRALSLLPEKYTATFVVSMESSPDRISRFLGYAYSLGVADRVRILMNIAPASIANLYKTVAAHGGVFVSTSLGESFGFGVAEAQSCGLPVTAYDVGALKERAGGGAPLSLIPVGDVRALAFAIEEVVDSVRIGRADS